MTDFKTTYLSAKTEEQRKVALYLDYVDINDGYLHDAVLFSQIMYWHLPTKKSGASKLRVLFEGEYWIAKNHDKWWDECRVKAPMVRKALKRIEERGLIHYAVSGFGGKKTPLVRINWEGFQVAITSQYDTLYQTNMIHCNEPNTDITTTETTKEKDSTVAKKATVTAPGDDEKLARAIIRDTDVSKSYQLVDERCMNCNCTGNFAAYPCGNSMICAECYTRIHAMVVRWQNEAAPGDDGTCLCDGWFKQVLIHGEPVKCTNRGCGGIIEPQGTIYRKGKELLCSGCWLELGDDSTIQNVPDDMLPKTQQLPETQYDMLRNMEDHGVGDNDNFACKDAPRADIIILASLGYCKLLIDANEWVATDTGRDALKAYQDAQTTVSDLEVTEAWLIANGMQCGYCSGFFRKEEMVRNVVDWVCKICAPLVAKLQHSSTVSDLTISFESQQSESSGTEHIAALCEVPVVDDASTDLIVEAIPAPEACIEITNMRGDMPFPIPGILAKPKTKKARKAKALSADTLMKNGLVAAMGHEQKDVTCWGEYQSASKKLRTAKFPVEELTALYQFSCQAAARGNYNFKSPMQLAKDLPDYRKAQRQQQSHETAVDDSKPLDPTDGVIRSEL